MEFMMVSLLTTIGGIIMYLIIHTVVRVPGSSLNAKFASLGVLKGKTYEEIRRVVGPENSISANVNGEGETITIRQWMATGYHIALLFDSNNICLGISHESKV